MTTISATESAITDARRLIRQTIEALDALEHAVRTGTLTMQELGTLSIELADLAATAKDARTTVDKKLIDELNDGGRVVVGDKVLTVKRGDPIVRMNAKKLLAHIAARCADLRVDPATGEVKPPAEFARDVVDYVARLSAIDNASHKGWRAKEFTAENLQLNDYRETEPGALKVEVK